MHKNTQFWPQVLQTSILNPHNPRSFVPRGMGDNGTHAGHTPTMIVINKMYISTQPEGSQFHTVKHTHNCMTVPHVWILQELDSKQDCKSAES